MFVRRCFRTPQVTNAKMSSTKGTLARKLAKGGPVLKLRGEEAPTVADIEDSVAIRSQYFSPIQTRHQRKLTWNPPQKYELPTKKSPSKVEPQTKAIVRRRDSPVSSSDDDSSDAYTPKWEPPYWQDVFQNIRKMRADCNAPVDTMGCHKCSDENADDKTQRFQKLVALMLSSQTKDETTYQAMVKLKAHGLTPRSVVAMGEELEQHIHSVSFYKKKAKFLRKTSQILVDEYDSDIPDNIRELVSLPGVGPKMAHICMATAWNEITGIGVDVHVHRITNRLRWTPKETKDPEKTRISLEDWVPRDLWGEVNHLLVGFGQTVCTPLRPHCGDCLNRDICPSAFKSGTKKPTVAATKTAESNSSDIPEIKKAKFQRKKMHL